MGKAVDFEKIRKRRQRATVFKRLLILSGVIILVGMAMFLNNILVEESVTTRFSDIIDSMGGSGYPIPVPGGLIRDVKSMGNNLAVLNDTSLYIYSPKGKTISNIQKMNDQSVVVTSSSRVLAFAIGNKTFAVHSRSKELFSKTLEYGVMTGDLNERGDFAIVAPVKQFSSKVTVYNKRFDEIYYWSTPEYVTHVSLSPKGDMMAVCALRGQGGVLESLVYLFRFSEDKEQATVALTLPEQLVLELKFEEDDRVRLLTDRRYLVLDNKGREKYSYDFAGTQILGAEFSDRRTLLHIHERDGKAQRLVLLDASLLEKASLEIDKTVLDIALSKDTAYVLTQDGVMAYDLNFEEKFMFSQQNISEIQYTGGRLYYLTPEEICVLSRIGPADSSGGEESHPADSEIS